MGAGAVVHAIWNAPDGTTIDVTPFHDNEKHWPITLNESVLFLLDGNAQPKIIGPAFAPLPSRFLAIGGNKALSAHVCAIAEEEERQCRDLYRAAEASLIGSR